MGDYFVGVICDKECTQHGDGIGMASGIIGQGGGGTGTAFIYDSPFGWEPAVYWHDLLDLDLGVFPVVEGGSGFHEVTFNLDMTDAVAVGGVEFDPAIHDVYITGSLADWTMPGENHNYKLQPVSKKNSKTLYDWTENWQSYADWTAAGGDAAGNDNALTPWKVYNFKSGINNWGASDFDFPNESTDYGVIVFNPQTSNPSIDGTHPPVSGSKYASFTQANTLNDNKWLISPAFEVSETSELTFWAKSITDAYGLERIRVLVSTSGTDVDNFVKISSGDYIEVPVEWTGYNYNLSAYAGQTIHFAIQYLSYDAFFLFLDDFRVTNISSSSSGHSNQYFITLNIENGDYEYKYFIVENSPTWDMGEWAGDTYRNVNIYNNMVVNNTWGEHTQYYNLSLIANPIVGGTVSGAGNYSAGQYVTVSATPATGYSFNNWTLGGTALSSNPSYSFYMPEQNLVLTANFNQTGGTGGNDCSDAIDLKTLTSPYNGSTSTATNNFSFCSMGSSRDRIFYYDVEPDYTFKIWQSWNDYDSRHTLRWGGACPGTTQIDCIDDPDYTPISWTNNTGSTQRVWFIIAGYASSQGNFTLNWTYMKCEFTELPYYENFDTVILYDIPTCWNLAVVGYDYYVGTNNYYYYSPPNSLLIYQDYTVIMLSLPPINTPIHNLTLKFKGFIDYGSNTLQIGTLSDPNNVNSFTTFQTVNLTNTFEEYTIDFSGYTGAHNYIGIKYGNEEDYGGIIIDDVSLISHGPQTYTLTLVANPHSGGIVYGGGNYEEDESVTVTATPASGYQFVNWTIGASVISTNASFNYTMPASNVTLTANFEVIPPDMYTLYLTASPTAGGTLTGGGSYGHGTVVPITATANEGFIFHNWKLNGTVISTSPNFNYTMPANDVMLGAHFGTTPPPSYILTLLAEPLAGGQIDGGGSYVEGSVATVTATPEDGYYFYHWKRGSTVLSLSPVYNYQMPGQHVTLTAVFSNTPPPTYSLILIAEPNIGGIVTGDGSYLEWAHVPINAIASEGYYFYHWKLDDVAISGDADFVYIMPAEDVTLTAIFGNTPPPKYTLSLISNPGWGGSVNGAGDYVEGKNVTVYATAASGYTFLNWKLGTEIISTTATFIYLMPNEDVALTASFRLSTNINENPLDEIVLYPNPVKNKLIIKNLENVTSMSITNLLGQTVIIDDINGISNKEISTESFAKGMYLVTFYGNDGKFSVRKIVKD